MKPEPVAEDFIPDLENSLPGRTLLKRRYLYAASDMDAALAEIAELTADRDSWSDQCSQRVADWDDMRKERDAAKALIKELADALDVASSMDTWNAEPTERDAALIARANEMTGGE